jgi:Flp pilus assembly pilin Flp
MRLITKWWKRGTGIVTVEYLLLAAIVGIALIVGCSNLATALYVGAGESPAPASTHDGGPPTDS